MANYTFKDGSNEFPVSACSFAVRSCHSPVQRWSLITLPLESNYPSLSVLTWVTCLYPTSCSSRMTLWFSKLDQKRSWNIPTSFRQLAHLPYCPCLDTPSEWGRIVIEDVASEFSSKQTIYEFLASQRLWILFWVRLFWKHIMFMKL